ncbi:MAG: VOC family protein [Longimicrobiales bacterium]
MPTGTTGKPVNVESVTANLITDAIEPALPFWTEGLGFTVTTEVPEGDRLGFVILQRDSADGDHPLEVMLQTRASVAADVPALAEEITGPATLFLVVDSVEDAEEALVDLGAEVVIPRRQTFYGADEIFFRSPDGTLVGLAAFEEEG